LPSEQVTPGRGNGPTANSWKTTQCCAPAASSYSEVTVTFNGQQQTVQVESEWTMDGRRQRPWFRCPSCNRRCRLLHERDGTFVCRPCSGYDYRCRHRNRSCPALNRVRKGAGLPHRALARETLVAQVEIARLLRATVRDLERRAKRGGKR